VQDLQRENKSIKEQSQKSENLNNNVPYSYELATEVLPVEDSVEYQNQQSGRHDAAAETRNLDLEERNSHW